MLRLFGRLVATALLIFIGYIALWVFMGGAILSTLSKGAGGLMSGMAVLVVILVLWMLTKVWRKARASVPGVKTAVDAVKPQLVGDPQFAALPSPDALDTGFEDWLATQDLPSEVTPAMMSALRTQFHDAKRRRNNVQGK